MRDLRLRVRLLMACYASFLIPISDPDRFAGCRWAHETALTAPPTHTWQDQLRRDGVAPAVRVRVSHTGPLNDLGWGSIPQSIIMSS